MNYEEKYKEALERAKDNYNAADSANINVNSFKNTLIALFPELKEYQDERIKKNIIKTVELYGPKTGDPKLYHDMISWLEKQGKKEKDILEDAILDGYILDDDEDGLIAETIRYKNEKQDEKKSIDDLTPQEAMDIAVAKCFEQGKQKSADKVEPKFKVGDSISKKHNSDINKFGIFTITSIADNKYWYNDSVVCDFSDQDTWELVERPKKEWGEDDEAHVNSLLKRLEGLCRKKFATTRFAVSEDIDWLQSLKNKV